MNTNFSEQRVKMVDGQVRTTDVTDLAIIDAMLAVPREEFVGEQRREIAYIDEDIQIAPAAAGRHARYLMEPSPFAKLVQLANILPTDAVLDVGCGTGYSAAVLSHLAGSVVALESDADLAGLATKALAAHPNVKAVQGALQAGYAAAAPYDVIFVGGSVEEVPAVLFDQLKEGGRLVVVEGRGNAGIARIFLKTAGAVTGRGAFNAAIKPLPGFERVRAFEF